jgi:hypothetical protein
MSGACSHGSKRNPDFRSDPGCADGYHHQRGRRRQCRGRLVLYPWWLHANQTEAYTGVGAILLSQEGIKVFAGDYTTMVVSSLGGSGGGAAGVGGSLAVAVFTSQAKAYLGNGTVANAKALLEVQADSEQNVIATAISGAGGGAAGVAGSIVIKVVNATTQAYIGANARINQDSTYQTANQAVLVQAQNRVIDVGLAGTGAGGGAAGVGASLNVTIVRNVTSAFIGDGAWVNAQKDISVLATSDKYVNSLVATGAGGGAAGVAGTLTIIAIGALFDSTALSGLTGTNEEGKSVSTQEEVDAQITANPVAGLLGNAEIEGKIAAEMAGIGISEHFNNPSEVALNSTQAFIGLGAKVNAGRNLTVKADDKTMVIVAEAAGSGGGAAGVAGALAVVLLHDKAEAFIAAGAQTNAKGITTVEANTSDNVFAAGITGSGAGAAAVNGVSMVNVVRSETLAYIANNVQVNQDEAYKMAGQSVHVLANGNTYIVAVAGSGGGAGAAAVGGAANIGVLTKITKAFIGDNAKVSAQHNIIVAAESSQLLVAVTVSIFGAGVAAVNGNAGTFTFANRTEAFIGKYAFVDSEGNVKISAADDSLLISVVATGGGAGVAAVNGAVSVNTIVSQTRAYIDDYAVVNARGKAAGIDVYTGGVGDPEELPAGNWDEKEGLDLDGDGKPDVQEVNKEPDVDQDGNPDGDLRNGVDFNVRSESEDPENPEPTEENINIPAEGLGVKLTENIKGLSVVAVSNQKIITVTMTVAGAGVAAVTGNSTVNVLAAVTEAYVGNGGKINDNTANANESAGEEQSVRIRAVSNASGGSDCGQCRRCRGSRSKRFLEYRRCQQYYQSPLRRRGQCPPGYPGAGLCR